MDERLLKVTINRLDTVRWNTYPNHWSYLVCTDPDKNGYVWITNGIGERKTNIKHLELIKKSEYK